MNLSLNEVESTAKKAARGAGLSWGIAEEAGKAARWLCAQGINGCGQLARHLQGADYASFADLSTVPSDGIWRAASGPLCPLSAGASLSDWSDELMRHKIELQDVAFPMLLFPFAAGAARHLRAVVVLEWKGTVCMTDGVNASISRAAGAADPVRAEHVTIRLGGRLAKLLPGQTRADCDPADWTVLSHFASRTYAPATEQSRLLGAGAGVSDND